MGIPKRDFLFIDEAGDPGQATPYYIQGLLHITDQSLKKLNIHLGAFRYFGDIRGELKSNKLNKLQKEKLHAILKLSVFQNVFIKASAIYVDKNDYSGPFLHSTYENGIAWNNVKHPTKFRHLMMRKLLKFHFQNTRPQSKEIELIIDRFHSSEEQEKRMKNYLRADKYDILPKFLHITQADSRYLELLQITDWVTGCVKENYFTHPERNFDGLFQYIKIKQIKK